jgi:superfamily II DNA or RNA helicase
MINVDATKSALSFMFTDSYSGEQRVLSLWKEAVHHLLVPRAFWEPGTLPYEVVDCRPQSYEHFEFKSRIRLDHRPANIDGQLVLMPSGDNVQRVSLQKMDDAMGGVLQLACGKGKTVVALEKIAKGQVPSLVLLDNTNLLEQWRGDIEEFLDVPGGIGILASGKNDWQKGIVLATYQTVAARADEMPEEIRRWFGQIFWDEGHHVSAPVFSKTVDLFYGNRFSLTATPERDDGWHIIADFHIGKVLHKDLIQMMKANIFFYWTGLELDLTNQVVARNVLDVNGEVHLSKVKSYFGMWRERMWTVMHHVIDAFKFDRKVLVLSDSVDEVVNLMTMWTRGAQAPLYTDIPIPTPAEVGETLAPTMLEPKDAKKLMKRLETLWKWASHKRNEGKLQNAMTEVNDLMMSWAHHMVGKKIIAELKKRQKKFLKELINEPSGAGLMTYGVPPKMRQQFLADRQVVFAITKYGKEGMDCPDLDTVIVSSLFSSRNGLQQLMGRPTRPKPGKKTPTIVMLVDDVGQCHGMAQKLMKHLRKWPIEEGGPFSFELVNYPRMTCRISTLKQAFGL